MIATGFGEIATYRDRIELTSAARQADHTAWPCERRVLGDLITMPFAGVEGD